MLCILYILLILFVSLFLFDKKVEYLVNENINKLMKISTDYIKSKLRISELLKYYGVEPENYKENSWWCPIHESGGRKTGHKTASLIAKDNIGTATCMSKQCFNNDDIFGIIRIMDNTTNFEECKHKACTIACIPIDGDQIYKLRATSKICEITIEHIKYLESISITDSIISEFELKSQGDYILYPQKNLDGKCIGYKAIEAVKPILLEKKKFFFIDSYFSIWPSFLLVPNTHLLFVEGEKDCMRLYQELKKRNISNFSVITSTTGALSVPKELREILNQYNFKQVSIFYDNDNAGKKGSISLSKRILEFGIPKVDIYRFSSNKEIGYDISDFFDEGYDVEDLFNLEKVYNDNLFTNLEKKEYDSFFPPLTEESFRQEVSKTTKRLFKWFSLEDIDICIPKASITVIAAPTGHGKTIMQCNLALSTLISNDSSKVIYISLEEQRCDILLKMINAYADIELSINNLETIRELIISDKANFNVEEISFLKKKKQFFNSFLLSNRLSVISLDGDIETVFELLDNYISSFDSETLVIIDYVQLLHHNPFNRNISRQEELKMICQKLRCYAQNTSISIVMGSQFNRQVITKEDLSNINLGEAGDIERISSLIIGLWNYGKAKENTVFVKILKNRNGPAGMEGDFSFMKNVSKIYLNNLSYKPIDKRIF